MMRRDPRVSVLLPVWNQERYLAEAVTSVLDQSYRDFELLIIDDGSTDQTRCIANDFARRDTRVRVIKRDHGGIAEALNAGFALARGDLIARMDSDDIADPARLSEQVGYLNRHPECVVVGCNADVIDEDGAHLCSIEFPRNHEDIMDTMIHGCSTPFLHPSVVMRREALSAVQGYRPAQCPVEDLDLWLRLTRQGRGANLAARLMRYRRHRDTVTACERPTQMRKALQLFNEARRAKGLRRLTWGSKARQSNPVASYHNECARWALRSGSRQRVFSHFRASVAIAPFWLEPYLALLASLPPTWVALPMIRLRRRLRYRV